MTAIDPRTSDRPKVVLKLPLPDATIDRIVQYRLENNPYQKRWRWDLNDTGIASIAAQLPPEAGKALAELRAEVRAAERTNVENFLRDIENVGRLLTEESEEQ